MKDVVDRCQSCGKPGDTSTHVTRCEDPARVITFDKLINALAKWMHESGTEPNLLVMITTYLRRRGKRGMESVLTDMQTCLLSYFGRDRLELLAKAQDRIGWDCMTEGRIPKHFVVHQRGRLARTETRMTAKTWARLFITKLLQIMHKQWLLWNAKIHIKRKGDMNEEDHNKLLKQIDKLLWTDPEHLLPSDEHPLNEDFDVLGRASAFDQLLWVTKIEVSMKAMNHGRNIDNDEERPTEIMRDSNCSTRVRTGSHPEAIDSEGSGTSKKERWK